MNKGRIRFILVDAVSIGAGSTAANLQPAAGKQWIVHHAVGYHADVGAAASAWYCTDPVANGEIAPSVSLNPAALLPLGAIAAAGPSVVFGPLKCTYSSYYSFVFAASAAAKHGYVRAIVEEYSGVGDV